MSEKLKRRYIVAGVAILIGLWALSIAIIPRAHAQPLGTLQPWRITVPHFDADCGPCQDTTQCQPDWDRVTVIVRAEGGYGLRRYYRQYADVSRDSVLLVNDFVVPAGWYRVTVLASEPNLASCWSAPFGRVSRQNPAAVPSMRIDSR